MAAATADRYRKSIAFIEESAGKARAQINAGSSKAAQETIATAQEKLSRVPKKHRGDLPETLDALLAESQAPARATAADIIPDYSNTVAEYADYVRRGIEGLLSTADAASELAKHMLAGYERFTHDGAPDFMANSQNARDFASAIRAETERQYQRDHPSASQEEVEGLVTRVWRVYKNRINDLRASLCLELDNRPAEFKRRFPQAAAKYPDVSPSEAMSFFYKVDLIGPTERDRRNKKISRLRAKAETLPPGPEQRAILAEIQEIQESLGKPRVVEQRGKDLVRTTRRAVRQIGDATSQVTPEQVHDLPEEEKRVLAQTLPTSIKRLSDLLAAVVDES